MHSASCRQCEWGHHISPSNSAMLPLWHHNASLWGWLYGTKMSSLSLRSCQRRDDGPVRNSQRSPLPRLSRKSGSKSHYFKWMSERMHEWMGPLPKHLPGTCLNLWKTLYIYLWGHLTSHLTTFLSTQQPCSSSQRVRIRLITLHNLELEHIAPGYLRHLHRRWFKLPSKSNIWL